MSGQMTDKEKLLTMLNGIYNQLEGLESALEASFSKQRIRMKQEEQIHISNVGNKLSTLENKWNKRHLNDLPPHTAQNLKLKMGY